MKGLTTILLAGLASFPLAAGTVNVTFMGGSGHSDSSGFETSPYTAQINGKSTTIYCDDFANEASAGESWTANITSLASLALLPANATTNTRYFGISQTLTTPTGTKTYSGFQLYEMAAYLTTQFNSNVTQDGIVQDTLWDLFNPNSGNPGVHPPQASSNTYLFAAEANYATVPLSDFFILTNTNEQLTGPGQTQEFFFVTPEPSTTLLLGMGLMAVATLARRRRGRKA